MPVTKRLTLLGLSALLAATSFAAPTAQAQGDVHDDAGSGRDAGPDHRSAVEVKPSTDELNGYLAHNGSGVLYDVRPSTDADTYEFDVSAGTDVYIKWDGPLSCAEIFTPTLSYVARQPCDGHFAFTAEVSGPFKFRYGYFADSGVSRPEDVVGPYSFTISRKPIAGVGEPSDYQRYEGSPAIAAEYPFGEGDDADSGRDGEYLAPVPIKLNHVISGVFSPKGTTTAYDYDSFAIWKEIEAGRRLSVEILDGPDDLCVSVAYLLSNQERRTEVVGCEGTSTNPFNSGSLFSAGITPERTTYEVNLYSETATPGTEYQFIVRVDDEAGPISHNLPAS